MQLYLRSRHDFHHALLGLLVSEAFTFFFTSLLKVIAGRPRPDFDPITNNTKDSRMSFPSGHSSTSFSGMVFLSLYLAGKLRILSNHNGSMVAKTMIVFSPLLISMLIAVSRTMDYHHNFGDIVAGSLLGAGISLFTYFLYFPSLFHISSQNPKSLRSMLEDDYLPQYLQQQQQQQQSQKQQQTTELPI